jgi:PAS domain S-box-containing protein
VATDNHKSKQALIDELTTLRKRVAALEALESKHQRVEEALRVSETKHRALLESVSDGVIVTDADGYITLVNARTEEMFGYRRDELVGQKVEILLPRHVWSVHEKHRERFLSQPRQRPMGVGLDLVGLRKNGQEFPVGVSLGFADTGDEHFVVSFVSDVTDRKRTEAAMQKRNRDLALLNRAGQTLTATLDLDKVVVQLLNAVTETIGAQASSVWLWDPERPGWLICQAAFDSGESYSLANISLSPGQGIAGWVAETGKSVIVSKATQDQRFSPHIDSRIGFQTVSLLAVPLKLRETVLGVVEVVNKHSGEFDQDDQALVETLAASAAIALDNARLIEALRQQADELKQRNEELDAYAHTVAHDLKGPTGLIIGFAQTLEENFAEIPPKEMRRHLRTITRNGRKMNNIIKELLLMSSVRKAHVESEPLDMASIVVEAVERLAFEIDVYEAEIIVAGQWPVATGYAPWLEEVWVNYISNAIKYGGRPPRIELGASKESTDFVRFWVHDNGPGISPEDQIRLFTPYTQLDTVRAQGHGLGLSIVQRIVEKLGGETGIESSPDQGSTFFFTLPRSS